MANMKIKGIEGMSASELSAAVQQGGRFVYFQYCLSVVIMTFKRPSDIYFIAPGSGSLKHSAGFTLTSLLLGWWGIPWGPIYTLSTIFNNVRGGIDVTDRVMSNLVKAAPMPRAPGM